MEPHCPETWRVVLMGVVFVASVCVYVCTLFAMIQSRRHLTESRELHAETERNLERTYRALAAAQRAGVDLNLYLDA